VDRRSSLVRLSAESGSAATYWQLFQGKSQFLAESDSVDTLPLKFAKVAVEKSIGDIYAGSLMKMVFGSERCPEGGVSSVQRIGNLIVFGIESNEDVTEVRYVFTSSVPGYLRGFSDRREEFEMCDLSEMPNPDKVCEKASGEIK
jgi:hypothetical protein